MKDDDKQAQVQALVDKLHEVHHFVSYEDAKLLLTEEEFKEFDDGCKAATICFRQNRDPTPEEQTRIDRQHKLRAIAASRRQQA